MFDAQVALLKDRYLGSLSLAHGIEEKHEGQYNDIPGEKSSSLASHFSPAIPTSMSSSPEDLGGIRRTFADASDPVSQ